MVNVKKFLFILTLASALLCLAGCSSLPSNSVTEDDSKTGSTDISLDNSEQTSQENNSDISVEINTEIISELGMTYSQLSEKYGEPHGINNAYEFGSDGVHGRKGFGRYCWRSDEGTFFDDMEQAGGCNYIMGIKPEELFCGLTYPMGIDEMLKKYDLEPVSVDTEVAEDGSYWAEFTSPLYDNISFVLATTACKTVDERSVCYVVMDVDCLEAVRVI